MIVNNDESRLDAKQQKPCFLSFLFLNKRALFQTFPESNWILAVVGNSAGALGEISLGSGGDKPPPQPALLLPPPLFLVHSVVCFLISAEAVAMAAPTNIRLCRRLQTDSRRQAEGTFPPPLCAALALPGCNGRGHGHLNAWGREVESEGGVGGVVQGDEKCRKLSPTFPFPPPSATRLLAAALLCSKNRSTDLSTRSCLPSRCFSLSLGSHQVRLRRQ